MPWTDPDEFDEDEITDEEFILDEIRGQIRWLWHGRPWCNHVRNVDSQWKYIQAMRAKYVFPDYLTLVGEPDACAGGACPRCF